MSNNKKRVKELGKLFKEQYLDYKMVKDDKAIEFSTNGSDYRIYLPKGEVNSDGSMDISIKLDHIISLRSDDHAEIKLSVDENGQYRDNSFRVSFDYSDAPKIPDWFVDTSSKIITIGAIGVGSVLGAGVGLAITSAGTAVTGGTAAPTVPVGVALGAAAGSAVTTAAVRTIGVGLSGSMSLFNYLSPKIAKFSDDGGSVFFTEVIAHAINKINTAVLNYNNISFEKKLQFNNDKFIESIGQRKWDDKDGSAVKYKHNGQSFRTWKQEVSVNYLNIGMLVSCKIDRIRDHRPDDHVILKASYDMYGRISSAQATLSMSREPTVTTGSVLYIDGVLSQLNSEDEVVTLNSYNSIFEAIEGLLESGMRNNKDYSDYSKDRKSIPYVVQANLINMSISTVSQVEELNPNENHLLQPVEV